MEKVIIAIGCNLGDRLTTIRKAGSFLEGLSEEPVQKAAIWESEPLGDAKFTFYNTAIIIHTNLKPDVLLHKLKQFEQDCGREKNPVRWGPRILDLDIITYGNLVIETDSLIIPHPEYRKRRFVLLPMAEIDANRIDPETGLALHELIKTAPELEMKRTELTW